MGAGPWRLVLSAVMLGATCGAVAAAEIVMYPTAIDTALRREVFNRNGRYVISGDPRTCAWAVLESPASSFREGRLFLRMRFASSTAMPVGNQCVGGGEAFWVTVSAEPYFERDVVGLRAPRLEEGKDVYRPIIELFLTNVAPSAINFNLRDEIAKMLRDQRSGYTVTVPMLDVQSVAARDNALAVRFDFRLEAR